MTLIAISLTVTLSRSDTSRPVHPLPPLPSSWSHGVQDFFAFALLMSGKSLDIFHRGKAVLLHCEDVGEDERKCHCNRQI